MRPHGLSGYAESMYIDEASAHQWTSASNTK